MSRIGLYAFDITIKQLFQESVEEEHRGIVGGLQQSLESFFGLIVFVLGIIFPNPNDFYVLAGCGCVGVGLAFLFYWVGLYRRDSII